MCCHSISKDQELMKTCLQPALWDQLTTTAMQSIQTHQRHWDSFNCKAEFGSRVAMACYRRHPTSIGTPCEDPKNAKSISYTGRASALSSIDREHDTLATPNIFKCMDLCMIVCIFCSWNNVYNFHNIHNCNMMWHNCDITWNKASLLQEVNPD